MSKELKIGDWYYRMMGYGGSDSHYCCIMRKTGEQTASGMMSLCNGTGKLQALPVSDIYEAVDERGRTFKVSANDLAANGHIGLGTLEDPKSNGHIAWLFKEDARLLVETGKYTAEEITAVFPMALTRYDEDEYENYITAHNQEFTPMTAKQEEILKAAYAANCEKEKREREEADRKFREAVEAAKKELYYIPCKGAAEGKWLSCGEKRRNVLAVLKHKFPGVKFSVRTRNGSTSDSVTVEYEDGPAKADMERVVDLFQTTEYNAYEDYHESVSSAYSVVCGGFDYAFVERKYSADVHKHITDWLLANVGGCDNEYANTTAARVMAQTAFPVGGYELAGMEHDENGWHLVVKPKTEPKKPTPPDAPKGSGDGVEVTENKEKNGIEIRFPSMPSEHIRNLCKESGYRWSRFSKCWYNKMSNRAEAAAELIVAEWEKENGKAAA